MFRKSRREKFIFIHFMENRTKCSDSNLSLAAKEIFLLFRLENLLNSDTTNLLKINKFLQSQLRKILLIGSDFWERIIPLKRQYLPSKPKMERFSLWLPKKDRMGLLSLRCHSKELHNNIGNCARLNDLYLVYYCYQNVLTLMMLGLCNSDSLKITLKKLLIFFQTHKILNFLGC